MDITRADFVAVPSTDWERSRAFYVDTLGLRARRARAGRVLGRRAVLRDLGAGDGSGWSSRRSGTGTSPLAVDDVAAARAELEAKGVEFSGETLDSGVCHMAFFRDPDGNDLMLHHRYAPRAEGRTDS